MLLNPSFEGGWTRKTHTGQEFGEIFVPEGWTAYWKEGKPVPHDPTNPNGYGRPEMHVINKEAPFLDPPRIHSGNRSVKLFTFFRIHFAGLYQRVQVTPGSTIKLSGFAHAWSSNQNDAKKSDGVTTPESFLEGTIGLSDAQRNFTFRVGVDPYGMDDPWSKDIVWGNGKHIYNKFDAIPTVEVPTTSKFVTVFVQSEVLYPFQHCDSYIDFIQFEEIQGQTPPTPECKGLPRVDYSRTYHLAPKVITNEQRQKIEEEAFKTRSTFGFSADDAGIGDLTDKTVKVWWFAKDSWESKAAIDNFFASYYPGTKVVHVLDYVVEPPVGNEPKPIAHPTRNYVGLHHCFLKEDWDKYLTEAKPSVVKTFACGDTVAAKKAYPGTLAVWRKHVSNDGGWLEGDLKGNAKKFFLLYKNEIELHSWNNNTTVEDTLSWIDVLESINETVPTNNAQHIIKAVTFDCYFSDFVHEEFGDKVKAGLLTVAVGNPSEAEVPLLLPCAKLSHERGDFCGYHSYWAADNVQGYIQQGWPWHAGRAFQWDIVFNSFGYYPVYYFGESGICYTYPESNGTNFVATRGWKSCGDFPNYIKQIEIYNNNIIAWNKEHQGRCYGGTLFTYGSWGWENFEFNPGDLALLTTAMKKYV